MYEAIIFDKDGCLFEFDATWSAWAASFLRMVSLRETVSADRLAQAIGFDLAGGRFAADSPVIADTPGEIVTALLPHLPRMNAARLTRLVNNAAERVELVEAVPLRPLLAGLQARGFALGLATNDAEAPALAHLRAAGVLEMFDCVFGSDSGAGRKPGPGQLLAFCRATSIAPSASVMVGDSPHDMQAARAAGMTGVAVLTGPATRADLAPAADAVLPDIGHLPGWLDRQGA